MVGKTLKTAEELIKDIEDWKIGYEMAAKIAVEWESGNRKKRKIVKQEDEGRNDYPLNYPFELKNISTINMEKDFLIIYLTTDVREIYRFKNIENCEFLYKKLYNDLKNSKR